MLSELIKSYTQKFADAGFDDPAREVRYVVQAALSVDAFELMKLEASCRPPCLAEGQHEDKLQPASTTSPEEPMLPAVDAGLRRHDVERTEAWLNRRLAHEPLARIEGKKEFWGLEFHLNNATLEPRADSETLIEAALKIFPDKNLPLKILDIGTGTGCLLLSLLHEYKNAQGIGTDMAHEALIMAKENAARLDLSSRADFMQANWAEGLSGAFDLIISNPPYIRSDVISTLQTEVQAHDPLLALDGGSDGLAAYRAILPQAHALLKTGGWLICEIGYDQEKAVTRLFTQQGFTKVKTAHDLGGNPRIIYGES